MQYSVLSEVQTLYGSFYYYGPLKAWPILISAHKIYFIESHLPVYKNNQN